MQICQELSNSPEREECSISLHDSDVPQSIRGEMERLYQNTFSSALAENADCADTGACIVRRGPRISAILLFRVRHREALVVNSAIRLGAADIASCVECLFERYPQLRAVRFSSVMTERQYRGFPRLQLRASEDYVVTLPPTVDAYKASLGKSTHNGLRYKQNKLRRDHPGLEFHIHEGSRIDAHLLDEIFALKDAFNRNGNRLDEKQKAWMRKAVAEHGYVGVSTMNGRLCAGAICTRVGNNFFLHVLAHDPAFDCYSLGMLNSYLTVCEAIQRGGKEFHFLWGSSTWKGRLGARPWALDDVVVYRSRAAMLLSAQTVASCLFGAYWRRVRLGLIKAADPARPLGWLLRPCLAQWYRLKRFAQRPRATAAQGRQA